MNIINGDCLTEMSKMESNSISGIVTDPPYGLSFMNKEWDHGIPGEAYWKEALRICKPGSHLLAFGGTRTFHRLACAIEDAGWEIRDCVSWLYAQGFPKSHNHFGIEGYGTALKPAWEPILVCMKPCDGTFAQNAEKWGQAGINIDSSRIGKTVETWPATRAYCRAETGAPSKGLQSCGRAPAGRWPANLILDEEAGAMLDEQSGISVARRSREGIKGGSGFGFFDDEKTKSMKGVWPGDNGGGASRFFYCAKASSAERGESNTHPTVKPLKLMEYLIKLIAPPKDAIILDPFMGSGTTLLACQNLGIKCVGIEMSADYCEIAASRLRGNQNLFSPKLVDRIPDCIERKDQSHIL